MKTPLFWILSALIAIVPVTSALALENQPPLKLQSFQGHTFESDKERAFNATFAVLQDLGCTVVSADIKTGYISAQSPRTSAFHRSSPDFNNLKFTAFVTQTGRNQSRVRLTAVRRSVGFFSSQFFTGAIEGDEHVEMNISLYERFFARVLDNMATRRQIWGD